MSFYDDAFNKIKIIKPNIKDKSIHMYLLNILKISKELFLSDKPSINFFIDFNSITKYIDNSIHSLATRKNIITSILVLVKAYHDIIPKDIISLYIIHQKKLSTLQEDSYLDNIKSTREETNWITSVDITSKIRSLYLSMSTIPKSRKLVDIYQQHLILNLYTLLPPLRNDYVLVKVINDPDFCSNDNELDSNGLKIDKNFNYINLNTKQLLLCKYKTDKYYGIKKIQIPEQLYTIICNWELFKNEFFKQKLTHNFLLLSTTNLNPMKHNTLTKYINKIFFPKKISTTLLRKIYLSEKYPVINTYRDQAFDAMVMGHSLNTQKMIYSKK